MTRFFVFKAEDLATDDPVLIVSGDYADKDAAAIAAGQADDDFEPVGGTDYLVTTVDDFDLWHVDQSAPAAVTWDATDALDDYAGGTGTGPSLDFVLDTFDEPFTVDNLTDYEVIDSGDGTPAVGSGLLNAAPGASPLAADFHVWFGVDATDQDYAAVEIVLDSAFDTAPWAIGLKLRDGDSELFATIDYDTLELTAFPDGGSPNVLFTGNPATLWGASADSYWLLLHRRFDQVKASLWDAATDPFTVDVPPLFQTAWFTLTSDDQAAFGIGHNLELGVHVTGEQSTVFVTRAGIS